MAKTTTTSGASSTSTQRPWVERYRPRNLSQVSHQEHVVQTLQNAVQTGRLPHLLLYGPPGSGKTSVALALCKMLWPQSELKTRVLELNASDERGISVVRDKIKHFASLAVGGSGSGSASSNKSKKKSTSNKSFFTKAAKPNKEDNTTVAANKTDNDDNAVDNEKQQSYYPNPPFKIIILDEADTVTPDAQAALRRIIESYSKVTRFVLICNYVTRIIEPLASRCAKFRFHALPADSMKSRLEFIAQQEGILLLNKNMSKNDEESKNDMDIDDQQHQASSSQLLDDILTVANGDMRRAVTTLQSVHACCGSGSGKNNNNIQMDRNDIYELAGLPPTSIINNLWNVLSTPGTDFDKMKMAVEDVCYSGFSVPLLLQQGLLDRLLSLLEEDNDNNDSTLDELSQAEIAIRMAEAEKNMQDGADEYLQLLNVCSLIFTCYQKTNT